jgi:hypothetical protein
MAFVEEEEFWFSLKSNTCRPVLVRLLSVNCVFIKCKFREDAFPLTKSINMSYTCFTSQFLSVGQTNVCFNKTFVDRRNRLKACAAKR